MLCVAAPASAANRWIQKRAPLNIAHQGGEDEFPSNTLYAFRKAKRAGAEMLELDIGVTKDNKVIVMHDTSVDRTTNGTGLISELTLKQIKKLDAAYWFAPKNAEHYSHELRRKAYKFRGIATGKKRPPKKFKQGDFRVPTLKQVLKKFPRDPINIEIKGRTPEEETSEYVYNAEVLASLLGKQKKLRPRRLIVTSFHQDAVDRFHSLMPGIGLAPGTEGFASWFLGGGSPGQGVVAFQVPITFQFGSQLLQITTAESVGNAHSDGYAWHNWFGGNDSDSRPTWGTLIDECVDGIITARPRQLEKLLKRHTAPASCAGS
jgi:glycerophosphoryl diester phosphodiesterase